MGAFRSRRLPAMVGAAAAALLLPLCLSPASSAATTTSDRGNSHQHAASGKAKGYVALGDSYSSGEGTGVYYAGTDTADNACHRSPLAYGPLLRWTSRQLRPFTFKACSGAVTHDFYAPNHSFASEPAQLSALSRNTRAVSMTIGGNDAGFVDVVSACLQTVQTSGFGCSQDAALNAALTARLAGLAGLATVPDGQGNTITPISTLLADVHSRSPKATIYLAGYPELFGSRTADFTADPTAPSGFSCVLNPAVAARIDYADSQWFLVNTRRINAVLEQAVSQARAAGVRARYVPASTFNGHGRCDSKRAWIQPLLLSETGMPLPESLHPTPVGQALGYAKAFHRAGL